MTDISRRLFLASAAAASATILVPSATVEDVVELSHTSVFFAPYLIDRLVPSRPVRVVHQAEGAYVLLDGQIIGKLPRVYDGIPGLQASVKRVARNDDGRILVSVAVSRSAGA